MIKNFIFCFALLLGAFSHAQLPAFTLEAEATPETCFNNGTISVSVSGTAPGATVSYELYLLPDEVTIVATGSGDSYTFAGLGDGAYKVVATQSLGGDTSTEEENVVVENQYVPITSENIQIDEFILCGDDGELTITLNLPGVDVIQYQLLAMPSLDVVVDWQASNVFSDLVPGSYLVRIETACGITTRSHNLLPASIGDVEFLGYEIAANFGPDCQASMVTVLQDIRVPEDAFPITVTFTVYPPDGSAPVVVSQVIEFPGGADPAEITVVQNIPYYEGVYFFDVNVTNACGELYSFSNLDQPVLIEFQVTARLSEDLCYGIDVITSNFRGGYYTIEFTEYPDGFIPHFPPTVVDPEGMNYGDQFTHVDPMTGESIVKFGVYPLIELDGNGDPVLDPVTNLNIPILAGDYVITVTDGCGFVEVFELTIQEEIELTDDNMGVVAVPPFPFPTDSFLDCAVRGAVVVQHPDVHIAFAEIISGPADFDYFLANYTSIPPLATQPLDISVGIDPNDPKTLNFLMPLSDNPAYSEILGVVGAGDYVVRVIDICGNEFILEDELTPFVSGANAFTLSQAPGCDALSSIHILPAVNDTAGNIESILVLDAPTEFETLFSFLDLVPDDQGILRPEALPYAYWVPGQNPGDPGQWHIAIPGLPPGDYEFDIKISCIGTKFPFTVEEYYSNAEITNLEQECGTFSFMFEIESNSNTLIGPTTYVLQRSDDEGATWQDVMPVTPGIMNNNITTPVNEMGLFRVVKRYPVYQNTPNGPHGPGGPGSGTAAPSPPIAFCTDVVLEFDVASEAGINDVFSFSCPDGGNEVVVEAVGPGPLTYYIVNAAGDVIVDNGENNIFADLEPGTYLFKVDDACGGTVTGEHQIGDPIEFEVVEDNLCDGEQGSLSVQNFSFFSYEWYKVDEDGNEILVGTGSQLTFDPFDADNDGGDYFVRIIFDGSASACANQDLPYEVTIDLPNAGEDNSQDFCHTNQNIDLFSIFASDYDEGGTWEEIDTTGALNDNIFNTEGIDFGTYTFRYVVDTDCFGSDEAIITVNLLDVPNAPQVLPISEVCVGEDLDLSIDDVNSQYTYTWTFPNGNTYTGAVVPLTDVTTAEAGAYTVIASLGDCESDPTTVTVTVNPVAEFTINVDREICTTLTVIGSNFTTSEATYVWTFGGNAVGTEASIMVDEIGEYRVEVTLNGCTSALPVTVDIPVVVIESGCTENQFMLTVLNAEDFPNSTFNWTGPNYSGTGESVNISGEEEGDYMVTITDSEGCTVSMPVEIDGTQCMIPKGFSPNGDGINETFDLSNFNVSEVQIFNRYGKKVYDKTDGYVNEWHGQTNNSDSLLPSATYYYVVTFVDGIKKTGWVYLNREE